MKNAEKTKDELSKEIILLKAKVADLEKDKEIFQIVAENTSDSISITTFDLKAKYIYVSPSVKYSLGYDPEDLIGKSFFDFIHKDDKMILLSLVKKYIKLVLSKVIRFDDPEITETIEYRFIDKEGSWHFLQSTLNFIGKNLLAITRDITESRKAEEELRKREEDFRSIFNVSPIGIEHYDAKGMQISANNASLEMFGVSDISDLKEFNLFEGTTFDDLMIEKLRNGESVNYQSEFDFEKVKVLKQYKTSKSGLAFFDYIIIPLMNEECDTINGYLLQVQDITKRKRAEQELIRSEKRFKSLYESLGDAVYVTKIGGESIGQILEVNLAAIKQTGYTRDELLQMNIIKDLYVLGSANIDTSDWERKLSKGERVSAIEKKKRKDGTEYWTEIIVTPIEYKGEISALSINHDITERIQSEMTLKESEEKFRTFAETISSAIMMYQNNKWVYSNNAATVITGYTQNELLKMNFWEIVHPEYVDKVKNIGEKRQSNKYAHQNHELKILTKSGEEKWVWLSGAITIYKNKPAGIITAHDVSSHKQSEKALMESENKYRNLFTSANDAIFLMQGNRFISCNPKTLEMFACNEEDIIGQTPIDISPEFQPDGISTLEKAGDKINAALKGKPQFFEWIHQRFDGTNFYAEISLNKIVLSDGEYIQAIVRDISERKDAEEKQAKSDERYRLISDLTSDYLFSVAINKNGIDTPTWVSGSFEKITGYTFEEYCEIGGWSAIIHEDDIDSDQKTHKKLEQNQKILSNVRNYHKNGNIIWVQVYGHPVWDEVENRLIGIVGAVKDITEQKKSEQNLKQALEKATESDRLKSAFLATMSHELRTPLNAIIGFSDFIDEDLSMEDIISFNKTINSSGNHLLNIVNDLFDITLIESGQTKIERSTENLHSLLKEIHEIVKVEQQSIKKTNLDLNLILSPADTDLEINTDSSKFKQILINLIKNALKFTNEGNVEYGYTIEMDQNKSVLKFYVEDTGIGVPEYKREFIFDIFRQAQESYTKTHGGTGIGLTISKKLIELLGGRIWLESKEENLSADKKGGTTFYFTIPNDVNKNPDIITKIELIKKTKQKQISKKKKIVLIVEDDESSFEFLNVILEKEALKILWAKNGELAIKCFKENPDIDLILMDINMPVMDGYEATKLIKELEPELPIIAQTAYAIVGDRQKSIDAGCDDYISKPIKRNELLSKIEKFI